MTTPEQPGAGKPKNAKSTLGLTGLTSNAMALIAPGAFLWLTFQSQAQFGAPVAGMDMWFGIVAALLLCLATAISYAELSKLFPGAGSSYLYAEQAFLSKTHAYRFARIAKFFTGWASHLYYWVYPGLMVGVTALLAGYLVNQFLPDTFSGVYYSPLFMFLFCVVFSFGVAYIAYRGVSGTTGINAVINIIQIVALIVFSVIAIKYRISHPQGSNGWHLSNGVAVTYAVDSLNVTDDKGRPVQDTFADGTPRVDDKNQPVYKQQDRTVIKEDLDQDKNKEAAMLAGLTALKLDVGDAYPVWQKNAKGDLVLDKSGAAQPEPFKVSYAPEEAKTGKPGDAKDPETFNFHAKPSGVVKPHNFAYIFIQACIAILILVGFESVTAMGEEARDAKRDIPRAVLLSLLIQGCLCYLFEYFAANYFLHNGYTLSTAAGSGAPIGDMMVIAGSWVFGSYAAGKAFMLVQAATVFIALIGTTLSCLTTGARVTYAMGRDEEVPSHFGLLHGKTLSPHRAIWALAVISAVIGMATVAVYLGNSTPAPLDKHNFWYSFGIFSDPATYAKWPNTLVVVTLISNFGTFMLYMMTCLIAIVAFREHHSFHGFKHMLVPIFGLLANLACMLFYLVGPQYVTGMSHKEPFIALGVAALWGIYGAIYFKLRSVKLGREVLLTQKPAEGR